MAKQRKGTGAPRENPPKERAVSGGGSPSASRGASSTARSGDEPDFAVIARAVGIGFVILTAGSLTRIPVVVLFLAVVSAAVAGWMTGRAASKPVVHGALAAVLSLALTVPVWVFSGLIPLVWVGALHLVAAVVVGGLAGRIGARNAG